MNQNTSYWHKIVKNKDVNLLFEILDDEVMFHSPVLHAPQKGKKLTQLYLQAALHVFLAGDFKYVREVENDLHSILEFELELDGIKINGVDMISWNDDGKIIDFKVMIRPLKAINLIHQKMGEILMRSQK